MSSSRSSQGRQVAKDEEATPSYAQALAGKKAGQAVVDDTGTSVQDSTERDRTAKLVLRPRRRFTPESRPARRQTAASATEDQLKAPQEPAAGMNALPNLHDPQTDATTTELPSSAAPLAAGNDPRTVEVNLTSGSTLNILSPARDHTTSIELTTSVARTDTAYRERTAKRSRIPPGNWRETSTVEPNSSTHRPRHRFDPKTRDHGVHFSQQKPGAIFCRWDIRHVNDPSLKVGDPHIIEGPDGRPIYKNERFFVVIDSDEEEQMVAECPFYTFGNKGLSEKPIVTWWEYLSVIPRASRNDYTSLMNQVYWNPVWNVEEGTRLNRSTIVVKYIEVFERSLDCDELKWVGELDAESTEILRNCVEWALTGQ